MLLNQKLNQTFYQNRRVSAWVGIAAILMLFIAPVVSVSLALSYGPNTAFITMVDCDMDMAVVHRNSTPEATSQADHTTETLKKVPNHGTVMMGHIACGYCLLLTHLPLLNTAAKADIRSVSLLAATTPLLFTFSQIIKDTYSEIQPRAPPTFYS